MAKSSLYVGDITIASNAHASIEAAEGSAPKLGCWPTTVGSCILGTSSIR